jgi:hypothetical protein
MNAALFDGQGGRMTQDGRRPRYAWIIFPFALLVCFVITFNPDINGRLVTFSWLAALLIWALWHFQVMSRASWDHTDSFICAYLALSAFMLVLRDPERRTRWLGIREISPAIIAGGILATIVVRHFHAAWFGG